MEALGQAVVGRMARGQGEQARALQQAAAGEAEALAEGQVREHGVRRRRQSGAQRAGTHHQVRDDRRRDAQTAREESALRPLPRQEEERQREDDRILLGQQTEEETECGAHEREGEPPHPHDRGERDGAAERGQQGGAAADPGHRVGQHGMDGEDHETEEGPRAGPLESPEGPREHGDHERVEKDVGEVVAPGAIPVDGVIEPERQRRDRPVVPCVAPVVPVVAAEGVHRGQPPRHGGVLEDGGAVVEREPSAHDGGAPRERDQEHGHPGQPSGSGVLRYHACGPR